MKVLAFAASNSRKSINKALVSYAADLLQQKSIVDNPEIELIDLNDFEMPIYSVDREEQTGVPEEAQQFFRKIGESDALLIAYAEHNGFYTAAFKNLFDWASRVDKKVYQDKPAVLFASSPGPGGARNVLKTAKESASFYGMDVRADVSIPRFYESFDLEQGRVRNTEVQNEVEIALAKLN